MPHTAPIVFGPQTLGSLSDGGAREWLVTDGLGGYACGTASGLRTRRQHGLLVVADPVSGQRRVAVAALDLTLTLPSGAKVALFTHRWASGVAEPAGHRFLETFTLRDGLPRWRWRVGDVVVEREIAMRYGRPSVAVVHRVVSAPGPVSLAVAAMCTWRDADATRTADRPAPDTEHLADGVIVEGTYRIAGPGWQPGGEWHLGASTDGAEDLWHAGTYVERVNPGAASEISAWAGALSERPPPATTVVAAARERAHRLITGAKAEGYGATLVLAADTFVVHGADGPEVVAGYPWPGHRPADPMASYEGLFLETGRAEEGRVLLTARTRAAARGAREPWTPREPVDAPLWLVHAVERHVSRTGDSDLAAELAGPLGRLLRHRLSGSGPLTLDPHDGLLRLAPGGPDARTGKPVEINALWVNALAAMCLLLAEAGRDSSGPQARHDRARASFEARFPAPEGWLYDVIEGPPTAYPLGAGAHHDDPSLRPNQLLAWSLPHAPLAGRHRAALAAIGGSLLTPLGMRTLAPNEYGYDGTGPDDQGPDDQGPIDQGPIDQGTVLPWLLGPYADACAGAGLGTEGLLTAMAAHVSEWGLGSVSETAEGDAPHRATGCPFWARSVAEVLRIRGFAS